MCSRVPLFFFISKIVSAPDYIDAVFRLNSLSIAIKPSSRGAARNYGTGIMPNDSVHLRVLEIVQDELRFLRRASAAMTMPTCASGREDSSRTSEILRLLGLHHFRGDALIIRALFTDYGISDDDACRDLWWSLDGRLWRAW